MMEKKINKEWRVYYLFPDYFINANLENEPVIYSKKWENWLIDLVKSSSDCGEIYTLENFQLAFNDEVISDQGWIVFREIEINE